MDMTDDVYTLDRFKNTHAPAEYHDDVDNIHYVPAPCPVACPMACPVGTDVPSYMALIREQKWELDLSRFGSGPMLSFYAALRSKAKGLLYPSTECRRRGL
ncbi:MAG: hypothetical protein ACI8R4_003688 [Paracoccaceae bacterium]|jgi:hypothetical protein